MSSQLHATAALYPRERPGTHFTGGFNILCIVFKQKRDSAFHSFRKNCDWPRVAGHAGEIHHVDPILEEEGPDDMLFRQN